MVALLFPEFETFDRRGLADRLAVLAEQQILVGTSSWKYVGWLDQIYSWERYSVRGRFSKKRFEADCLREYSETFRTVCGDFAFYQFPAPEFWDKLFGQVPEQFQFAFKVPEQITRLEFTMLDRHAGLAGQLNPLFLDAEFFKLNFLELLKAHRQKVAVLILEFGTLPRRDVEAPERFLARLHEFLLAVKGEFRFAVEVRNPELLNPAYFQCLREHNVAHVYNAWARMPDLPDQIAMPGSLTADFLVCRGLLRRGRGYEEAVKKFAPYSEIREPYQPARDGLRELIQTSQRAKVPLMMFVNNRLEGNAPFTIAAVVE